MTKKLKNNLVKLSADKRLYQIPVPIIGLTGGIGTGKSTVAASLRKHGFAVIDADQNVKLVYQKPETLIFIKKHFLAAVHNEQIDFKKLREIVFINQDAKQLIEDYIYQHLPGVFLEAYKMFNNPEVIIYDVPLLFEKQLHLLVDVSVCVYAPREVQIQRLMARDHSTRDLAEKILSNQLDIEEKKKLSDFIIENTGDIHLLEHKVEEFLKNVTEP
jgi:dephospho-CoA kinase